MPSKKNVTTLFLGLMNEYNECTNRLLDDTVNGTLF